MDTIVACATPMGRSGIAVIRLSGPESLTVTQGLCQSKGFSDRQATLRRIFDGETCIDQVLVLWMKGPNSFTGEDVVEISCHGNPIVIQHIIELCMKRGARLARAGEFSRRAATNGKLSLIQAESLSALLSAKSRSAVVASQRGMNGDIENKIDHIQDRLLDYAAEIEARLDHPDGDLSYIDDQSLSVSLNGFAKDLEQLADAWSKSRFQLTGATIVIVGPVNAGKSSLFNALVGSKRAIVSEIAGTTRDIVERTIIIGGIEVCLQDTAGIRNDPSGQIERLGIEAGIDAALAADMVILLAPAHQEYSPLLVQIEEKLGQKPLLKVGGFADLVKDKPLWKSDLLVSMVTNAGISMLESRIAKLLAGDINLSESPAAISQRQHDLALSISRHLRMASEAASGFLGPAVASEELVSALERISEFKGGDVREQVLDRLFSRFCIGK